MPDNHETVAASEILAKEGFVVMPYILPDLITARQLERQEQQQLCRWGAPIGSNKGLLTKEFVKMLVEEVDTAGHR